MTLSKTCKIINTMKCKVKFLVGIAEGGFTPFLSTNQTLNN